MIGICGGFQMLGDDVLDPLGVESGNPAAPGLGLLSVRTLFEPEKATNRVEARVETGAGLFGLPAGSTLRGYEIHMGRSETVAPALRITRRSGAACDDADGAVSADGQVFGTYLHGLFENDALRQGLLAHFASARGITSEPGGNHWSRGAAYDRLAAHVRSALDMALVYRLIELT